VRLDQAVPRAGAVRLDPAAPLRYPGREHRHSPEPETAMIEFRPFEMERWQSTHENRVAYNLSESGVHPLTLAGLLELAGDDSGDDSGDDIGDTPLGYGQSNGSDPLRARIAALYDGVPDDGVVVTNGSAEANFLAVWELVRPGDEVAVLVPTYMQAYGMAQNLGARVTPIPLREELGWQPDPDEVRDVVTDRTRLIVVTNPGNPTGIRLHDDARAAVVDAAARAGAWILADEVYTGAELDGTETPSFFGAHDRVIATGSLSKAYGLPGLRIGWAATDPHTAEALWARSDYTTISTGELTDRLARVALDPAVRPHLLRRTRSIIAEGLDTLTSWMQRTGGFRWHTPDAGAICFVHYDAPIESARLAERLRAEQDVLIVPGSHFRLGRYIRFGTGMPRDYMEAALERITATMNALAAT
jgi:aspartate/methionine/tyrosine aminotransferase